MRGLVREKGFPSQLEVYMGWKEGTRKFLDFFLEIACYDDKHMRQFSKQNFTFVYIKANYYRNLKAAGLPKNTLHVENTFKSSMGLIGLRHRQRYAAATAAADKVTDECQYRVS